MPSLALRRAFIALSLFAWLAGGAWHGVMQVQAAIGEEVCTVDGTKRLPGGDPAHSGSLAAKLCSQCAAFATPALASAGSEASVLSLPAADPAPSLDHGAFVPAAHLADLASRAPPRA